MRSTATRSEALERLVAALRSGHCDAAAARELYALGPDAVALALLAAARRIAEQDARLALLEAGGQSPGGVSPGTPSGMRPVYTKPNATAGQTVTGRRRKRPGARDGHPGARTQAVLMSVYRTLRLRGHDPLRTLSEAVRAYLQTSHLPPLPAPCAANG